MKIVSFKLHPFANGPQNTEISIQGDLRRDNARLRLDYRLKGPLNALRIAPPAEHPVRRQELWKETCFECFIQPAHSAPYWEINLSPAGHWNFYAFEGYRLGMREEPAVADLVVLARPVPGGLELGVDMDLAGLDKGLGPLTIGLSAVILYRDGRLAYWALAHPGPKPDFHHPQSFLLQI